MSELTEQHQHQTSTSLL